MQCSCAALVLLMLFSLVRASRSQVEAYESLRNDLLNRSVAVHKIPPYLDNRNNTNYFDIMIVPVDILSIDDIGQSLTVTLYVQFNWSQPDLAWNASNYENLKVVLMDTNSLWKPLVYAIIGIGDSLEMDLPETLDLESQGNLMSRKQYQLTFRCKINFKKYPFDTQQCLLGFHVMANSGLGLDIRMELLLEGFTKLFTVGGEWGLDTIKKITVPAQGVIVRDYPALSFTLRRNHLYYVITIIFPLVLTSLMIPLVFLIPASTGEKISYLVAIFTSTAIFLNFICDVMPRGLYEVPYLAVLLIEVLAEGWFAMLASLVVVNRFYSEEQGYKCVKRNPSKSTSSVRKVQVCPAPVMASTAARDKENLADTDKNMFEAPTVFTASSRTNWSTINVSSTQLDHVFFILFSAVQIFFLLIIFCVLDWL
ncbi:neuronal acetylcholine receptor subunit alpha-7 [Biomphalaria glabrata]|nr:neuronal acetylcholine receptor subunit alpha-7 [Biomphalaria glabrata]